MMNRRYTLSTIAGAFAAVFLSGKSAQAQFTEQEVRNGSDVVATGDVNISQSASGTQGVWIDGQLVTEDGIYETSTGQVVVNNGRVVATGDVNISQSASSSQVVRAEVVPEYDGQEASHCLPGAVMANPNTGQLFYQREDCCWYAACANKCQQRIGCEGDYCG